MATSEYYAANRHERLEYQKTRYLQKRHALVEYQRLYRSENRERESARSKAWKKTNPDKARASARAAYRADPAKFAAKYKAYSTSHPEIIRQIHARRRARKLAAPCERIDYRERLIASRGICGICKQPLDLFGIDFDHIIPLSRGGAHTTGNIQATHQRCNRMKGAKMPQEMGACL